MGGGKGKKDVNAKLTTDLKYKTNHLKTNQQTRLQNQQSPMQNQRSPTGACVEKLNIAEKKHHPMKNQQGRTPSCPLLASTAIFSFKILI
jgi:hypothetical protein